MNESIGEYNARLSREIGSSELALSTIEGLIDTYDSASQAQMNTACNVFMCMSHYKAIKCYMNMFFSIENYDEQDDTDIQLMKLYYQKFTHWFDMNNAVNRLMTFYIYGGISYSSMKMDST